MEKIRSLLIIIVCSVFLLNTKASYAQYKCPSSSYESQDIEAVRQAIVDASTALIRMIVLASQSTNDYLSCTQRMAANTECD